MDIRKEWNNGYAKFIPLDIADHIHEMCELADINDPKIVVKFNKENPFISLWHANWNAVAPDGTVVWMPCDSMPYSAFLGYVARYLGADAVVSARVFL